MSDLWGIWHKDKQQWWWIAARPYMTQSHKEAMVVAYHARHSWPKADCEHDWEEVLIGEDGLPKQQMPEDKRVLLRQAERAVLAAMVRWDAYPGNPVEAHAFRSALFDYREAFAEASEEKDDG